MNENEIGMQGQVMIIHMDYFAFDILLTLPVQIENGKQWIESFVLSSFVEAGPKCAFFLCGIKVQKKGNPRLLPVVKLIFYFDI